MRVGATPAAVCRLLFLAAASSSVEQGLGGWALVASQHVDLPGPGIEHVSSALAGGFLTTRPKGSPLAGLLKKKNSHWKQWASGFNQVSLGNYNPCCPPALGMQPLTGSLGFGDGNWTEV